MFAQTIMNFLKTILGGVQSAKRQQDRASLTRPSAPIQPGAPAFSDHLDNPPEMTAAELKAAGAVATVVEPPSKPKIHLFCGHEVFARIINGLEKEIVFPEDLKELNRRQKIDDNFNKLIAAHTDNEAKAAWKKQRADVLRHAKSGDNEKIPVEAYSLEDFREDFSIKRQQFKAGRRDNRHAVKAVTSRIIPRIKALAAASADEIEKEERAKSEEWGLKFEPSYILVRVRYISENAEVIFQDPGGIPPAMALANLGIKIDEIN
jgi:hypothetical protein